MTNTTALKDLLGNVEAGSFPADTSARDLGFADLVNETGFPLINRMYSAFEGSLDAAKALHEAVFPYFDWDFANFTLSGDVCLERLRPREREYGFCDMNPARAWLIAILKALIAEGEAVP